MRATLAGAMVLLVAVGATLLDAETASVKLTIWPQRIEAMVELAGGPTGGALPTHRFQVTATESQRGSASQVMVDGRSTQVIQQSDYDAVSNALTVKLKGELGHALYVESQGRMYVGDSQSLITVSSDHAVGDETPFFTITMSGTLGATAFSEGQANAILMAALKARVPGGQEFTNDRVQIIFHGRQVGPNSDVLDIGKDVLVTGQADGFIIPTLSAPALKSQIRGLSPAEAAQSLQRAAPGSQVVINVSPEAMPRLPLIADHISLAIVVEPARW